LRETESERADDLPVIIHWLKQMEIEKLIERSVRLIVWLQKVIV